MTLKYNNKEYHIHDIGELQYDIAEDNDIDYDSGVVMDIIRDIIKKSFMSENTLIAIGYISNFRCYTNVEMDEAISRYSESEGITIQEVKSNENIHIRQIEFVDEFRAYDVWQI